MARKREKEREIYAMNERKRKADRWKTRANGGGDEEGMGRGKERGENRGNTADLEREISKREAKGRRAGRGQVGFPVARTIWVKPGLKYS